MTNNTSRTLGQMTIGELVFMIGNHALVQEQGGDKQIRAALIQCIRMNANNEITMSVDYGDGENVDWPDALWSGAVAVDMGKRTWLT